MDDGKTEHFAPGTKPLTERETNNLLEPVKIKLGTALNNENVPLGVLLGLEVEDGTSFDFILHVAEAAGLAERLTQHIEKLPDQVKALIKELRGDVS